MPMKTLFFALVGLLAAHQTLAKAPASGPKISADDDDAIRKVIDRMNANYTDHHFQDMATYTTPDVSWVNIVGMWWRGRAQVQAAHQAIFDNLFKGVAFTPGPVVIRAVTPEVAVVNATYHVGAFYPPDGVNRGTNKWGDNQNIVTLVMVKQQGRWLLTAGQNTQVDAKAKDPTVVSAK
ncbi:SgcJ/EcaC family oxidoreductase [Hymenobacter humi]|uniref:SgcJ/EcaC family oxidoreductase n=1 Tax=Hymenobacter humi TaxID=1411620 RepID=A0ABW2U5G1_9BACT